MRTDWRIGCSGFSYREWKEIFYPAGLAHKNWFRFYCEHFNCIEINSSFYKLPTIKALTKWKEESPPDFTFSMKAPRLISHYKQLNDCTEMMADFYKLLTDGLGEKLGIVLLQFPPAFAFNGERLNKILQVTSSAVSTTVEFRHPSWWNEEVYETLAKHNIIFCGQSFPGSLPDEPVINNKIAYYRFHGKPVLYKSLYDDKDLDRISNTIRQNKPEQAYIFFNNTWGESALHNSRSLKAMVKAAEQIIHTE